MALNNVSRVNPTGVTAGSYTAANITVDAQGRLTSAASGTSGGVTQIVAGSNVTISPPGGTGAVTINAITGGGGGGLTGLQEIDNITSQFNGTTVTFLLRIAGSNLPVGTSVSQLVIFIGGAIQNPGQAFTFNSATSQITFTGAPPTGQQFIGFLGGNAAPITSVVAGTGLSGGGTTGAVTLNLGNTAVTAGSYTTANITVNAQGQITAAANGTAPGPAPGAVGSSVWGYDPGGGWQALALGVVGQGGGQTNVEWNQSTSYGGTWSALGPNNWNGIDSGKGVTGIRIA
jgi:hypothetical protein